MHHTRIFVASTLLVSALVANCGGSDATPGVDDPTGTPQGSDDADSATVDPGQGGDPTFDASGGGTPSGTSDGSSPSEVDGAAPGADSGPPKGCTKDEDCATGCRDDHVCATAPSCTRAHGGRTCGANGTEDCCAKVKQGSYTLDKYLITAGRMRAFIERFQGNIAGYVATLPAGKWNPAWNDDMAIPKDMASVVTALGTAGKRSCKPGDYMGRTYWLPKVGDDYSDFDQDTLDDKALNCVPWQLLQALCAFDGGRLAKLAELKAAFTNGGTTKYPWGSTDYKASGPDPDNRLNAYYSYNETPIPADARKNGDGSPLDISFFISPPGKYPLGNNQAGVADAAGNLLEWVGDSPRQFVWKADWEKHGDNAAKLRSVLGASPGEASIWLEKIWGKAWTWGDNIGVPGVFAAGAPEEKYGYYSIGGRCAYDL